MNKTWFAQLIAVFVLAALAGLYLVPRTLSAEEMNQIVGACTECTRYDTYKCTGWTNRPQCQKATYDKCNKRAGCIYQGNNQCPSECIEVDFQHCPGAQN